jgi:hypothetical protein
MELIIKQLQIIKSSPSDIASIRSFVNNVNKRWGIKASEIKDIFRNIEYANFLIETELGDLYLYNKCLYNSSYKLLGVFGHLNSYIYNHLRLNNYPNRSVRNFFVVNTGIDPKFLANLQKYSPIAINILHPIMFEILCNAKTVVDTGNSTLLRQSMEYYLKENIGRITNLDLLGETPEIVQPTLFDNTEVTTVTTPPIDIFDLDSEEEEAYVDTDEFEEEEFEDDVEEEPEPTNLPF